MRSLLPPCAATGVPCSRCGAWAGQRLGGNRGRRPWRSHMGATGWACGGWRCCRRFASPLCVARCTANSCATRCSIWPL